jgi:hypothetical protein
MSPHKPSPWGPGCQRLAPARKVPGLASNSRLAASHPQPLHSNLWVTSCLAPGTQLWKAELRSAATARDHHVATGRRDKVCGGSASCTGPVREAGTGRRKQEEIGRAGELGDGAEGATRDG